MKTIQHFIGGKNFSGNSKRTGKVFNPATGEQSAEVKLANSEDIDKAVDTVHLSDEYDFLGDAADNTNSTRLNFTASLSDENGDTAKETLIIQATNPSLSSNENAQIIFKVRSIS